MILPDVNTLVYAFHRDSSRHDRYAHWLHSALTGAEPVLLADVDETQDEHVRGLCLNVVGVEHVSREVFGVVGDDRLGTGTDCYCEDVAVIGVWETEFLDQVVVVGDLVSSPDRGVGLQPSTDLRWRAGRPRRGVCNRAGL